MKNFKEYYILQESISQQNFWDIYGLALLPDEAFKENLNIIKTILLEIQEELVKELQYILIREAKYLAILEGSYWLINKRKRAKEFFDYININQSDDDGTLLNFKNIKSKFRISEDLLYKGFKEANWKHQYGGDKWVKIFDMYKKIKNFNIKSANANALQDFIFNKIDRLVDLVHNTGPALNKFIGERKGGWLLNALDFKAVASPKQILNKPMSSDVKNLIKQYRVKIDLSYIADISELPKNKIKSNILMQNLDDIIKTQKVSEDFIERNKDYVNWYLVVNNQKLSEPFIEKHKDYVNWKEISWKQNLSESFIEKYKDKIDFEYLFDNINISNELILDNIQWFINEDIKGSWRLKDKEFKDKWNKHKELYLANI